MRSELQAKPARGRERPQGEHPEARPSKHQLCLTKKGNLGAEIRLSAIRGWYPRPILKQWRDATWRARGSLKMKAK